MHCGTELPKMMFSLRGVACCVVAVALAASGSTLPKGAWNYVLAHGKDDELEAKESVVLVPSDPFVPGKAPVTISVPAKRSDFGGWGYMREVTTGRAVDPPPSPIPDEGGEVETLKLVPFGSTQLRISLFPWCTKKDR